MAEMMVSRKKARGAHQGIDVVFEPGVPRPVRDSLVNFARSLGAVLVSEAGDIAPVVAATPTASEPSFPDAELVEKMQDAMREILDGNERNSISTNGVPKVKAIEKLIGQQITTSDRDYAWSQMTHGG